VRLEHTPSRKRLVYFRLLLPASLIPATHCFLDKFVESLAKNFGNFKVSSNSFLSYNIVKYLIAVLLSIGFRGFCQIHIVAFLCLKTNSLQQRRCGPYLTIPISLYIYIFQNIRSKLSSPSPTGGFLIKVLFPQSRMVLHQVGDRNSFAFSKF